MHINPQKVNPNATEVCRVLRHYGHKAYIVGGCVRDLLLGAEPKDWDITTDADPTLVQKMFEKTYPTGLQHGTVTVAMNEEHFEVTTFRIEGEYLDGRRPSEVQFVTKIEDDLARRDLTINAMAYDPISEELVDPYEGLLDLQNRKIRCVGSAITRFTEDGLRIMRVARFAARFGYEVDQRTVTAMGLALEILAKVSKERIKDELWKTLQTEKPSIGLNLLKEAGVLEQINSEWNGILINQHISNIDFCQNAETETKFAILCSCFTPNMLEKLTKHLKLSNNEFKKIKFLLDNLTNLGDCMRNQSILGVRTFLASIKNNTPDTYENSLREFLIFSDALGLAGRAYLEPYLASEKIWARSELQLNGNDLLELGIPIGPEIKRLLTEAYNSILNFPETNERSQLLAFVQKLRS